MKIVFSKVLTNNTTITTFCSLFLITVSGLFNAEITIAEETQSSLRLNRLFIEAEGAYLSGHYDQAISNWRAIIKSNNLEPPKLASVYENLASLHWHLGYPGEAIQFWQESIEIYRGRKERHHKLHLAAVLLDQSQAYNDLGQPRFSLPLIEEALAIIDQQGWPGDSQNLRASPLSHRGVDQPSELTPQQSFETPPINSAPKSSTPQAAHSTLQSSRPIQLKQMAFFIQGNIYSLQGDFEPAIHAYQQSLSIKTPREIAPQLAIATYTNLSQAYQQQSITTQQKALAAQAEEDSIALTLKQQTQRQRNLAIEAAQMAVKIQPHHQSIERAKALIQLSKLTKNHQFLVTAEKIVSSLPNSSQKVYTLLHLASERNHKTLLLTAVEISQEIGNLRVASFALGALGQYYEQKQDYQSALSWTEIAQVTAAQAQAPDSLYQWNWQAGRIFKAQGNIKQATAAYENALASLQSVRREYAQAKSELLIDFQTEIEPVYRQYLELLLAANPSSPSLQRALEVKQLLQLSELENFFQDDCLTIESSTTSELENSLKQTNTAIVTTVILQEQTHVIWQLPNGQLKTYAINISQFELLNLAQQWRFDLENLENDRYLSQGQQLYHLLLAPMKADLAELKPQNLIFVNDGILRNLPMAALHDGKKYLVENYAVTNSLGLNLKLQSDLDTPIPQEALLFGLSTGSEEFFPLPYVVSEIESIGNLIAHKQKFIDREFSPQKFSQKVTTSQSSIIHIATHGSFAGTIEDSFLQAWNGKINLRELENALTERNLNFDKTIKLLTLSACDTATGNERATLGMSGIALRAGVENTLGSLWSVDDRQTAKLVNNFYRYWLQEHLPLGEALRQAQLRLINHQNFPHPATWSGLILIQN